MNEIIWRAIHAIEETTKKDGLFDMSAAQLRMLVLDVYYILEEVKTFNDDK